MDTPTILKCIELAINLLTPIAVAFVGFFITKQLEQNKLNVLIQKDCRVKWADLFLDYGIKLDEALAKIITILFEKNLFTEKYWYLQEKISKQEKVDERTLLEYQQYKEKQRSFSNRIVELHLEILKLKWIIEDYSQFAPENGKTVKGNFNSLLNIIEKIEKGNGIDNEEFHQLHRNFNIALREAHKEILSA